MSIFHLFSIEQEQDSSPLLHISIYSKNKKKAEKLDSSSDFSPHGLTLQAICKSQVM